MYDPNIRETYEKAKVNDPRSAAEIAYVLAVLEKRQGCLEAAKEYAQQSVDYFSLLNIQTLEEAASVFHILNGVCLPDLIHEDVVMDRIGRELGVKKKAWR